MICHTPVRPDIVVTLLDFDNGMAHLANGKILPISGLVDSEGDAVETLSEAWFVICGDGFLGYLAIPVSSLDCPEVTIH